MISQRQQKYKTHPAECVRIRPRPPRHGRRTTTRCWRSSCYPSHCSGVLVWLLVLSDSVDKMSDISRLYVGSISFVSMLVSRFGDAPKTPTTISLLLVSRPEIINHQATAPPTPLSNRQSKPMQSTDNIQSAKPRALKPTACSLDSTVKLSFSSRHVTKINRHPFTDR